MAICPINELCQIAGDACNTSHPAVIMKLPLIKETLVFQAEACKSCLTASENCATTQKIKFVINMM